MRLISSITWFKAWPLFGNKNRADDCENLLDEDKKDTLPRIERTAPDFQQQCQQSMLLKLSYLAAYLLLNLMMALSNKAVLQKLPLPWLLTAGHSITTYLGCFLLLKLSGIPSNPERVWRPNPTIVSLATLFTANVGISNASLALVSVSLHQLLRTLSTIVTTCLCTIWFPKRYSKSEYMSMLLLTIGSVLATFGEADWTSTGLALTLLGGLIGPLKALVMYKLITRSAPLLTPWDILYLMTPIAALQSVVIAWLVGEVGLLRTARLEDFHAGFFAHWLLLNLFTAFVLNVCYSQVTVIAGPLGMSICANVRQILTIGFGMLCFGVAVNWLNGVGLVLAMAGLVWFSRAQLRSQGVAIPT